MAKGNSVSSSLVWKFIERVSVQLVQLIVSIVIARILLPEQYGVMAILNIFISISATIVQSGLAQYLIQKENVTKKDYSTVLTCSFSIALVLYLVIFIAAPYLAVYFDYPELKGMLRVLAISLFITAVSSVQMAFVRRNMLFANLSITSLISAVLSGIVGILLALKGAGAWALVFQQLVANILTPLILLFSVEWKPQFSFDKETAGKSFKFGIKVLGADLIDQVYHSLESIIMAKFFSKESLGVFTKGRSFPLLLVGTIDGSMQSVMYPAYSRLQNDVDALKTLLRRSIRMSTYLSFLSMAVLFAISDAMVPLLLGAKWNPSIPYIKLYCLIIMLFPLQTAIMQAFMAKGFSGIYMKLTVFRRFGGAALLFLALILWRSPFAVVITALVVEIVMLSVVFIPCKKIFGYTVGELFVDILPSIIIASMIILVSYPLTLIISNNLVLCILVGLLSIFIIILASLMTHNESFYILLEKIKPVYQRLARKCKSSK